MALHVPMFMQPTVSDAAINYSAQEFRQYVRAMLTADTAVGGEQGILAPGNFLVAQRGAGANLSVDVASGLATVVGDDVSNQGTYQVWNDGTVNVTGWTVPGAGTFHHRLVLQVQDKLNNGAFSGYVANLVPVLDTGGGLPAEPNSAITLATIDILHGSASIVNANINDYRQQVGRVQAVKTGDTSRTTTSTTNDPDLQLLNLQPSAWYAFSGSLIYNGGAGASEGDLDITFNNTGITLMKYNVARNNTAIGGGGDSWFGLTNQGSDTLTCGTNGTSTDLPVFMEGFIHTSGAPCSVVLQWGLHSNNGTTTMRAGSRIRAVRYA